MEGRVTGRKEKKEKKEKESGGIRGWKERKRGK